MNLLVPGLWPLAALGLVPILVHLLIRRRHRHVRWAAMDFLLAALRRRQRRIQYRDVILMLLRALALTALGLAVMRPALTGSALRPFGAGADVTAALVLDASLSMQHTTPSGSRFNTARRLAGEIVGTLPSGSAAALFLAGGRVTGIVPEPSHELAFVAEQIARCRVTDGGSSIREALAAAWKALEARPTSGREIYIVTDLQAGAWPRPDDAEWDALLAQLAQARPRPRLYIVNVDDGGRMNTAVGDMRCTDPLVSAGETVGIAAGVVCHGPLPRTPLTVDCLAEAKSGGNAHRLGRIVIEAPAASNPVRFEFALDSGEYGISLHVDGDRVAGDNTARLALPVRRRLRVLLIDGAETAAGSSYDGEAGFLRAALLARVGDDDPLMDVTLLSQYAVAGFKLDPFDVVALANVATLSEPLAAALTRQVRIEGRGLIVFAGSRVNAEQFNTRLGTALLPLRIGVAAAEPEGKAFGFSVKDPRHPIVRFFNDPENRYYLSAPRFQRARRFEAWGADEARAGRESEVALRFDTGRPALVAGPAGRGWVLLFATDAAREWSNMPLHPAYLMLMRRAVQFAAQFDAATLPKSVTDALVVTVPGNPVGVRGTVRLPIGETRAAFYEPAADEALGTVRFADTLWAGFYRLGIKDGSDTSHMFAVNPPPDESDLAALTPAEVGTAYPGLGCTWVPAEGELGRIVAASRTGTEIWRHLLLLACLCLVTEQLLAAHWAPRE